jgi:hypothetical protein
MPMQPGDVRDTYADISAIQRDLGFQPTTSIDVGVPRFVDWYRAITGSRASSATASSGSPEAGAAVEVLEVGEQAALGDQPASSSSLERGIGGVRHRDDDQVVAAARSASASSSMPYSCRASAGSASGSWT